MTEQEREEIVRQMAVAIRKQKFVRTGRIGCFDETNITDDELSEARAALAVAEPVIREQTGGKLRAENARLREALLIAELMASEMGIDPREKCQKIYEYLHDIREGGNEN